MTKVYRLVALLVYFIIHKAKTNIQNPSIHTHSQKNIYISESISTLASTITNQSSNSGRETCSVHTKYLTIIEFITYTQMTFVVAPSSFSLLSLGTDTHDQPIGAM